MDPEETHNNWYDKIVWLDCQSHGSVILGLPEWKCFNSDGSGCDMFGWMAEIFLCHFRLGKRQAGITVKTGRDHGNEVNPKFGEASVNELPICENTLTI